MTIPPEVISVNVGQPREFELNGRIFTSAIWKFAVAERLTVSGVNVEGDDQADRTVHGGYDKAVYVYAHEDYLWWADQLGFLPEPGMFGENLTVSGIEVNEAVIGERWRIGGTVLEVTQPRLPCFKLGVRMGDRGFPRRFIRAARWGAYLAIVEEGDIGAGDRITVTDRPDHRVSVDMIAHVYYHDHSRAEELLQAATLPIGWREWAEKTSPGGRRHRMRG
jgi:MOSC domain-containing protein YiiM